MPFNCANGIKLHYRHQASTHPDADSHPPLLMIAGMASDSMSWQPIVEPLARHRTLLLPDNRCTGQTTPMPVTTHRDLMIDDLLALLDSLDIDQVSVLGHSMGGMLAWTLASRAPDRVAHLITAAALPTVMPARLSLFNSLAALRRNKTEAEWFELLFHFLFRPAFFSEPTHVSAAVAASRHYPYKQSADAFVMQVAALSSFAQTVDMSSIRCPITIMTGDADILLQPKLLQEFGELHPHIHTHIIPEAAHALHWEQTDAVVQCVLRALQCRAL